MLRALKQDLNKSEAQETKSELNSNLNFFFLWLESHNLGRKMITKH